MNQGNVVPVTGDLQTTERTVHTSLDAGKMTLHILVPGDICVSLDDPNLSTDATVGVVVNSAQNNAHSVEVKFGIEPIRTFDRKRLLWAGAIE